MIKNILFDLDGTLTDPQEGILNCIEYALEKLNVEKPERKSMLKYIGPSLWESFKEMLNTDKQEEADKAVQLYRERFSSIGKLENKPYDGIFELLEELQKGYTLYICTSKPEIYASQIAEHFGFAKYFKKVYGSMLDGSLVDKKLLIAHILDSEKISNDSTVMIGDRIYDIEGAKSNGLKAFAVSYGYGCESEHSDAEKVFNSTDEIKGYFI